MGELHESGSITDSLAAAIQRLTYTPVTAADFETERIPAHLRPTFSVMDERGTTVASAKDLGALQEQLKSTTRESVARASVAPNASRVTNALERTGLTTWDFDGLPRLLDTRQGSNTIRAYPALIDAGTTVSIRLMSTPGDQTRMHAAGVRRMLQLAIPSPVTYVQDHLTTTEKLSLTQSPYRTTGELFADCMVACIDAVVGDREIYTLAEFELARDEVSATIMDSMFATASLVSAIVLAGRVAEKAIKAASSVQLLSPLADMREQLGSLIYPGFVSTTGLVQLRRTPLYLAGIVHRIDKLGENLGRDRVWMTEVQTATQHYESAGGTLPLAPGLPADLKLARWMLEELRISLFAQHLGAVGPVSLQRIVKALGR